VALNKEQLEKSLKLHEGRVVIHRRELANEKKIVAQRKKELVALANAPVPLRLKAFAEAKKLLGTLEQGGNNTGPVVDKIIKESGGKVGDSWCGWFVAYCYAHGGSKLKSWQLGAVRLMDDAGLLKVRNPQRGHVVRFTFNGKVDAHTGLFDEWHDRDRGLFYTIEGNTGTDGAASDGGALKRDGVHRRLRHTSNVHDYLRFPR
jgi:hypothetical protein